MSTDLLSSGDRVQGDVHHGDIAVVVDRGCGADGHFVNHVHASDHFAKNRIARIGCIHIIQRQVVRQIDIKLGGGTVGVRCSGHGQTATDVAQSVLAFQSDTGVSGRFWDHACQKSATLDDKPADHTVKNGVGIKTVLNILEEIVDRQRCCIGIEFKNDQALTGHHADLRGWDCKIFGEQHVPIGIRSSQSQRTTLSYGASIGQIHGVGAVDLGER